MPANISLKPRPTSPWPICLAPRSTRLVAWSTLVLSAAAAVPEERATAARNPGAIHVQRRVRVITHLHQSWGSRTHKLQHPIHGAFHVPTGLDTIRRAVLEGRSREPPGLHVRRDQLIHGCATPA